MSKMGGASNLNKFLSVFFGLDKEVACPVSLKSSLADKHKKRRDQLLTTS